MRQLTPSNSGPDDFVEVVTNLNFTGARARKTPVYDFSTVQSL